MRRRILALAVLVLLTFSTATHAQDAWVAKDGSVKIWN